VLLSPFPHCPLLLPGVNVASHIRCYKLLWTLNPLRKVLCHEKVLPNGGVVSAVAVSTLKGHILQGESKRGGGGDVTEDIDLIAPC